MQVYLKQLLAGLEIRIEVVPESRDGYGYYETPAKLRVELVVGGEIISSDDVDAKEIMKKAVE